jgi:hypothetical protein
MLPVALTNGDVIVIIIVVAIPIGILAFILGARNAYDEIGKGAFGLDHDAPQSGGLTDSGSGSISRETHEAEVRQLLEAKAYRQSARGEEPVDVDAELERLLSEPAPTGSLHQDRQLVEEVRQLVVARNERRLRQGKDPLEVEAEVARQLRDLENLGQ